MKLTTGRGAPSRGVPHPDATTNNFAPSERAREAGAEIALELTDTDHGSRDFTARDPEGTLWSAGTYRPAV